MLGKRRGFGYCGWKFYLEKAHFSAAFKPGMFGYYKSEESA